MNKNKDVIVVEGQSDVNKLRLLIDADFVITNGSEISRETIEYIKTLSLTRRIIILTDPDYPGMRIREIISQAVPSALHALKMVRSYKEKEEKEFDEVKMYNLGLQGQSESSFLREQVFKQYNLGYGNAKTLCKRLNMIEVTYEEIKEFIDGIKNKKKG